MSLLELIETVEEVVEGAEPGALIWICKRIK